MLIGLYDILAKGLQKRKKEVCVINQDKSYSFHEVYELIEKLEKSFVENNINETIVLNIENPFKLFCWIWFCLKHKKTFVLLPLIKSFETVETYLAGENYRLVSDIKELNISSADSTNEEIKSYQNNTSEVANNRPYPEVLFLTSGSTGAPKILRIPYRQIIESLNTIVSYNCMPYTKQGCAFISPPLFHSYGFSCMLEYMMGGSSIILPHEVSLMGNIKVLFNKEISTRLTAIEGVSYFYQQLTPVLDKATFPNLSHIGFGGDFVYRNFLEKINENHSDISTSVRYGISEIPSVISLKYFEDSSNIRHYHNTGKPLPIFDIDILNEIGAKLPEGEEGDIAVIVSNFEQGTLDTYHTGDTGYIKNGELYVTGRKNYFIKCKGHKVYPSFIEHEVMNSNMVLDAKAIIMDNKLKIMVIPASPDLSKDRLRSYLETHLPYYAKPDILEFTSEIKRTKTGKMVRL
jgi:acyl-coenzyme A synthetase/AMP-(fatty) acid ligase